MRIFSCLVACALLTACGSSNNAIVPLSETLPSIDDNYTIAWIGKGESYSFIDGKYVRNESNDYSFEVIQRRYDNEWHSIKNMHRVHPEYDGKAGPREQTMFFKIGFSKSGSEIVSKIASSLGNGSGISDNEFREQTIQFSAKGISSFSPYNTYRITQQYRYEDGLLFETVELFRLEDDGKEIPFAKVEETAYIFRPTRLSEAPTVYE